MRILMIVNELLYTCGVSSHTYNLLSGLKDRNSIQLYLLCGGGNAIEKFNNLNIPLIVNQDFNHQSRSIKGYIGAIKFLYQIVRENSIDVIHSHHHYAASIANKVSHITKVKTIQTNHGLIPEVGFLNHFPAKYIIAVNEHIVNFLINKKIKNQSYIRLIRYGTPVKNVNTKQKNDKLKILAASRLVPSKGLDIYIRAINLLPKELRSKTEFYIAGEGFYEKELQNINKELKTDISFLGRITDLSKKLSEYDIFVMPTSSDSEGFPMTIIEAGMNRCVIISSDFLGLDSVFENKKDGLLFKKGDYSDLTEKIKYVIANFNSLIHLPEHFHKKILEKFSIEKMVSETLQFYNDILL